MSNIEHKLEQTKKKYVNGCQMVMIIMVHVGAKEDLEHRQQWLFCLNSLASVEREMYMFVEDQDSFTDS